VGTHALEPTFWTHYALPCWLEADKFAHLRDKLNGLDADEIQQGPQSGDASKLQLYPYFSYDSTFDGIRLNPPEGYQPTAIVLKKKFDAFLRVFIPLLRPAEDPDKYSDEDDIREIRNLRDTFNLEDPVGVATWYLFCVLHREKLLDPAWIMHYLLAHSTQASQS
jgi:hypothetical protein